MFELKSIRSSDAFCRPTVRRSMRVLFNTSKVKPSNDAQRAPKFVNSHKIDANANIEILEGIWANDAQR